MENGGPKIAILYPRSSILGLLAAHYRIRPASGGYNSLVHFIRSPCTGLVFVNRGAGFQHRVNDAPGLLHIVLAGKQGSISCHGVAEHPFVSVHLLGTRMVTGEQLYRFADHLLLLVHHRQTKGRRDFGADAEAEVVLRRSAGGKDSRRPAHADHDLRAGHGQRLAGPNVKRHTLPAPGIDVQLQRGEGLDFRVGCHAFLLQVATKLATDKILCFQRRNSFEYFNFFVPERLTIGSNRRLHRQVNQDLKQMVLNHVADGAGLIIERPPALYPEILRHGDLYALDLITVPERLEERILEAEEHHVMDWSFSQIMIDAKDVLLVESAEQNLVKCLRRGQVVTEGLFDDDAGAIGTIRFGQLFHNKSKQCGWDGQVVRWPLRRA